MMTTTWPDIYRTALTNVSKLATDRGLMTPGLEQLIEDLMQDAYVIEHSLDNRAQRRRLAAAREEPKLPL
jgi:hypothetical protein